MNQAQLQNFLATHSSGAATAGATGTSVASGASGASLEDSTTTAAAAAAGVMVLLLSMIPLKVLHSSPLEL